MTTASRRPYLDIRTPIAFAHRGGSKERPENTMDAFQAAVDLGYQYLETDAQLSRDGVLLAFHDEVLDRVTDLSGRVSELTLEEIKRADAGYRFSADTGGHFPYRGRGVRVPSLEEVLTAWPQVRVNVDAKTDPVVVPLVRLVARLDAWDRVCVGSFLDRRLLRLRHLSRGRICTSMGRGAVAAARAASLGGWMPALGGDCLQVPVAQWGVQVVDWRLIRAAHRAGLPVHVWTIDDRSEMGRLLDLDADGIMTDRPSLLREVMQRRGVWGGRSEAGGQRDSNPQSADPHSVNPG
ncbi:MAG: glycerophosphodiester phosphodiesterase [Candidatus Dormiibacterota bacterium]